MKEFSIFEYALKCSTLDQTENLGQLASVSRRDFEERESFLCHTTTPSIEYACLMIEHQLLLRTNRGGRVYAGFQKLSCMEPIAERYLRIADISESVYLFGEPDWQPPRHPNIRLVNLGSEFRLARETFLIAQSTSLSIAFVAFEEGGEAHSTEQRKLWALKTSEAGVVDRLSNALEGLIDWTIAA